LNLERATFKRSNIVMDISLIRQLIQIAQEGQLSELIVEEGDESLTIKLAVNSSAPPPGASYQVPFPAFEPMPRVTTVQGENLVHITSPMVGVFYRSPTPGAPAFVEVGSEVEVGQTVGLVEAMKVFNEIVSEVEGRVVAIPAQNEQLVQVGETLVIIERTREG
jgi:acetyl-CoA carboxylase biotin carboxyl carrier protein